MCFTIHLHFLTSISLCVINFQSNNGVDSFLHTRGISQVELSDVKLNETIVGPQEDCSCGIVEILESRSLRRSQNNVKMTENKSYTSMKSTIVSLGYVIKYKKFSYL